MVYGDPFGTGEKKGSQTGFFRRSNTIVIISDADFQSMIDGKIHRIGEE
jgi:hypothetical protein